ncbi:MAG: metal-dependent hydrolase [Peptococcaceae bacterium]|nr:metal-dependent hydrolase [Peptococcaceae bacterium]
MKVIFHGHACFEIVSAAGNIIIDPFLRHNPQAKLTPDDFEELDAILISHGHSDHLGDAIELAQKTGALIVSNFEIGCYAEKFGVRVHHMHIGGKYTFPFGTVKLTPAFHGSGIPDNDGNMLYGGLACGFIINTEGKILYHAGDTGLFGDMELLGKLFDIDLAMLPIGDNYVMGPDDAIIATQMLRPKAVIPMHYNTFPVIQQDAIEFINILEKKAPVSKGILLQPGQVYEFS